jgi:hypothetical protein
LETVLSIVHLWYDKLLQHHIVHLPVSAVVVVIVVRMVGVIVLVVLVVVYASSTEAGCISALKHFK